MPQEIDELFAKLRGSVASEPGSNFLAQLAASEINDESDRLAGAMWSVLMQEGQNKPVSVYLELAVALAGGLLVQVVKKIPKENQKEFGNHFIGYVIAHMALFLKDVIQQPKPS